MVHNECSGHNRASNSTRALAGGRNGSPEKQYFKVSNSTFLSPVALSLSDKFRSDFKQLRNMV